MYTLTVASADPKSITANKPVHFTKSVTKWLVLASILIFQLDGTVVQQKNATYSVICESIALTTSF